MEKEIKLIVCDVDGTILPSGKYEISERLREDFHKAMKKGIKVMINTGRHYTFLPQSFFKDLPMDRIGTINGACLVDRNGNPIEKHPMSEKEMNDFIEISDKYGIGLGFKFEDSVVTYANHEIFMAGYDAFLKSVTKADSIIPVLKENNITWDNVIAFGDAGNDTTMIAKAGIGVAMGNSKDDVKEYADIIADTCENDGVAKVLEDLKLV